MPSKPAVTVETLQANVAQRVPTGSSVGTVEAYLATLGLQASSLVDNANYVATGADPATFELFAKVEDVRRSLTVTTDIQLRFLFDRQKRLLSTRIGEVHTGP